MLDRLHECQLTLLTGFASLSSHRDCRELQDQGPPSHQSELSVLAQSIRELLAEADSLGLPFVGVHLCDALEALQREIQVARLPEGLDSTNADGR
jgi:hypothetical protein